MGAWGQELGWKGEEGGITKGPRTLWGVHYLACGCGLTGVHRRQNSPNSALLNMYPLLHINDLSKGVTQSMKTDFKN